MTDESRDRILGLLGLFPRRVPPDVRWESRADATGYSRALVSYLVEPGERISAWLLRPGDTAPAGGRPAIIACHQHAGVFEWGKSEPAGLTADPMYHYGLELCRRGYVVICPDHLCFEDRRTPIDLRHTAPSLVGAQYELFEFTTRLLRGSCLQAKYLHDLRAAVDLVSELPEVDATRIGAIGHSLGGQEALWLTWFDQRIKVGVSSCGFAPLRDILAAGINHNKAMYIPGFQQVADVEDVVASLPPRAFFLTAGEEDALFPVGGVKRLVAKARLAYEAAGVAERFDAILFPAGHSFPEEMRLQAYAFLDAQLQPRAGEPAERPPWGIKARGARV